MKIIFMGTPDFAVSSLRTLLDHSYDIAAVVTAPDKPRGRGQQLSHTPVKDFALNHAIPILQPDALRDPQFISRLTAYQPDLFVVVAFRILPREVYTIPAMGSFNLHASLLPKYRGAAPINWAIMNGENESGVTTFFLQDKVDTGNIILQKRTPITEEMNAGALHDTLSIIGAEAVLETVRAIATGSVRTLPQDTALATPAPKIFKETCRINWNRSSVSSYNFIRGLSPYPAAWTYHNDKVIKIFSAKPGGVFQGSVPGTVHVHDNKLFVTCADGTLELLELQQEGKRRMSTEEFLRGYRFTDNDAFL